MDGIRPHDGHRNGLDAMKLNLRNLLTFKLSNLPTFQTSKRAALSAIAETDDTFRLGADYRARFRDRYTYDRQRILQDALRAWRVNPLARQIAALTTAFAVGSGISWEMTPPPAQKHAAAVWNDSLNLIDQHLPAWTTELGISGDLFILFTVVSKERIFLRAVPSEKITEIRTAENDTQQETAYVYGTGDADFYPAYAPGTHQQYFMRHYAVNRPVGALFGESDFAPLLPWFGYYTAWLENRATLNRFRTAFLYILRGKYRTAQERQAREAELRAHPPKSGSILVTDESEDWGILSANLDSYDASVDGLALKKMIATGAGFPLHWLAEPESATRTTAEAAGTPTFRRLRARQQALTAIVSDLLTIIAALGGYPSVDITIHADDITERDNASTSLAVARMIPAVGDLYDRKLISAEEYIRLVYRMAGETPPESVPDGLRRPLSPQKITPPPATSTERKDDL